MVLVVNSTSLPKRALSVISFAQSILLSAEFIPWATLAEISASKNFLAKYFSKLNPLETTGSLFGLATKSVWLFPAVFSH